MVGVPKSFGCLTCRKRKKKCGEERPGCTACRLAGWTCPGYTKTWKFVDEGDHLDAQYQRKRVPGGRHVAHAVPGARLSVRLRLGQSAEPVAQLYPGPLEIFPTEVAPGSGTFSMGIFWPLVSAADHQGALLEFLKNDAKSARFFSLQALGDFWSYVPARLGRNAALDTTISCLSGIFIDVLAGKPTSSRTTIRRYADSLRELQICVRDPVLRTESETLCASILLQLCELMTSSDNGRWNNLAHGSAMLIRDVHDPQRFATGFERAMLEAQRPMFIVQDFHAGRDCFLASHQWRSLLVSPNTSPQTGAELKRDLAEYLVDMPSIIRRSVEITTAETVDRAKLHNFREDVVFMKRRLTSWFVLDVEPKIQAVIKKRKGQDPGGVILFVVECVANSVFVKLDKVLLALAILDGQGIASTDVDLATYLKRQDLAKAAFDMVRARSVIAAKPLEFGLKAIWTNDEALDLIIESPTMLASG